ncbi:MAG: hypothetical protein M1825_005275 [Sarcosagium campestre]|nr:MAG: hypothetical protein M1825_005275 [Sarcosagium campestre]
MHQLLIVVATLTISAVEASWTPEHRHRIRVRGYGAYGAETTDPETVQPAVFSDDLPTSLLTPPFFSEADPGVTIISKSEIITYDATDSPSTSLAGHSPYVPGSSLHWPAPVTYLEGQFTASRGIPSGISNYTVLESSAPILVTPTALELTPTSPIGGYSAKPTIHPLLVPLYTPDSLGYAYGAGYDGIPVHWLDQDSVSTAPIDGSSAPVGLPIGYSRVYSISGSLGVLTSPPAGDPTGTPSSGYFGRGNDTRGVFPTRPTAYASSTGALPTLELSNATGPIISFGPPILHQYHVNSGAQSVFVSGCLVLAAVCSLLLL